MSNWVLPLLIPGVAMLLGVSLLLYRQMQQEDRLAERLRMARAAAGSDDDPLPSPFSVMRLVVSMGESIARSGLLSSRTLDELQQTLRVAGFKGPNGLGLFVGTKLLLMAGLPLAVFLLPRLTGMDTSYLGPSAAVAAGVGMLAPDYIVRSLRKRYLRSLEHGLPDALDLLVICSQAGLGLEASVERVGAEIRYAHAAVAEELVLTAREMRVNADVRAALINLGARTGLDSLRRLAAMLIQSTQYGTPLSQALRTLSAEERQEMLSRFEGRAARLPVLLTLPMIVFILPCVFLVVAGPAIVQVMQTM